MSLGSMSKPLNAARAAENGVFAAELAAQGFTSGELRATFDDCAQLVRPRARLGPAFAAIETVDTLPTVRQSIPALAART